MNSTLPISVIILTRNEEKFIARALDSIPPVAEVLVIDAESVDSTRSIAEKHGARVITNPWPGFREQRNFALTIAKEEWILSIDADEAITPELTEWLYTFFSTQQDKLPIYGYKIHRIEYFLGKEISGACWNPSYQDRFFRKDKAQYVGEIHEYPEVEGGLIRAPEQARLLHNPHVTVESLLEKMNRYTTVEAWDRYKIGERTNFLHMFVTFFSTWWKNYFYYSGYRDGAHGFVICLLEAISRTSRHIKLWQIQQITKEQRENILLTPHQALEAGSKMHRGLEANANGK